MSELFPELKPTDLTEQTYVLLKDRILARQLRPGERISVADVAHALGVSRTPVTVALKQLSAEGLVAIVPRVGTFVSRLTVRDVEEIFETRSLIEGYAIRRLFELGLVDQYLKTIEGPLARMEHATEDDDYADYETFINADRDLHMILVEFSGNQRLIDIYRELNVHVHITRAHYMQSIENARQAQQEHDAVIAALSHEGPDEAEAKLLIHIDNVCRRILELVEELGGEL